MANIPKRIKRSHYREKLPPNTKLVARPTRWGNPFDLIDYTSNDEVVALFTKEYQHNELYKSKCRGILKGYNLACYCELDEPCHADVLLKWANE